jgi:hypothetical protein
MDFSARHVSGALDVAATVAAAASIGFVLCALVSGAEDACVHRVFWSLCIGAAALCSAVLVDWVRKGGC